MLPVDLVDFPIIPFNVVLFDRSSSNFKSKEMSSVVVDILTTISLVSLVSEVWKTRIIVGTMLITAPLSPDDGFWDDVIIPSAFLSISQPLPVLKSSGRGPSWSITWVAIPVLFYNFFGFISPSRSTFFRLYSYHLNFEVGNVPEFTPKVQVCKVTQQLDFSVCVFRELSF